MPVLVVAGGADTVSGTVEPLVAAIPGAVGLTLPEKNHMNAVGDKTYKAKVVEFFRGNEIEAVIDEQ